MSTHTSIHFTTVKSLRMTRLWFFSGVWATIERIMHTYIQTQHDSARVFFRPYKKSAIKEAVLLHCCPQTSAKRHPNPNLEMYKHVAIVFVLIMISFWPPVSTQFFWWLSIETRERWNVAYALSRPSHSSPSLQCWRGWQFHNVSHASWLNSFDGKLGICRIPIPS